MDKLLVVGNSMHSDNLITYAKKRNIYTIAVDNLPVEKSPVKKIADESWDISVTDLDELEKAAREHGVNAILCGASELCMNTCRALCKRMNLPFYVSDKAWEITNNKRLFKEACKKHGIPVPKDYVIDQDEITFPVVVKPVDGCSSLGLHVCYNKEELQAGYEDALANSPSGNAIIEQYWEGEEVMVDFLFKDGKFVWWECGDSVGDKKLQIPFVFSVAPSKYLDWMKANLQESLEKLFQEMDCRDGVCAIQGIANGKELVVLEMNYRMPGSRLQQLEAMCNHLINFALPHVAVPVNTDIQLRNAVCYLSWLKPGTIAKIEGAQTIREEVSGSFINLTKKTGDVVKDYTGMRQIASFNTGYYTVEEFQKLIEAVNDNLVILDENGNDMVRRYDYVDGQAVLRG